MGYIVKPLEHSLLNPTSELSKDNLLPSRTLYLNLRSLDCIHVAHLNLEGATGEEIKKVGNTK